MTHITQVGVATVSEELLTYIKEMIKDGTIKFTDLLDAPNYAGQDGKFLKAYSGNGTSGMEWKDLPAAGLTWEIADKNLTTVNKIGYLACNGITLTLDDKPETGDLIAIADKDSEFHIKPIKVLASGGKTIEGEQELLIDLRNAYVQLIFDGEKWQLAEVNHPFNLQEITEETFHGGQLEYTLSRIPPNRASILVTVDGRVQSTTKYILNGNKLTFAGVPTGTIQVRHIGVPSASRISDTPVGAMLFFPNGSEVTGWLDCTGGEVHNSVYPDLVKYLSKDSAAELANLPDSRGNFIRVWDHGDGSDGVEGHPIPNVLATGEWGQWIDTLDENTARNAWTANSSTRTFVRYDSQRVGYAFDAPVSVTTGNITTMDLQGAGHVPSIIILQASNNGVDWVDMSEPYSNTIQNQTVTLTSKSRYTPYRYWSVKGTGGMPYFEDESLYWGVMSVVFQGSSTNRLIGDFQDQTTAVASNSYNGTIQKMNSLASVSQVPVLNATSGKRKTARGAGVKPDNQAYVLRIKAFHEQGGEISSSDVTSLRSEINRLSMHINDGTSYVSAIPPENPSDNARWYDTQSGRTYIWFNDGDSYQWVDDSPQAVARTDESINAAPVLATGQDEPKQLNDHLGDLYDADKSLLEYCTQSMVDTYGDNWFLGNGFLIVPHNGGYYATKGHGYIKGYRATLTSDTVVSVGSVPSFVYIDLKINDIGDGDFDTTVTLVSSNSSLTDYTDQQGLSHVVCKIASIDANSSIVDLRPENVTVGNSNEGYVNFSEDVSNIRREDGNLSSPIKWSMRNVVMLGDSHGWGQGAPNFQGAGPGYKVHAPWIVNNGFFGRLQKHLEFKMDTTTKAVLPLHYREKVGVILGSKNREGPKDSLFGVESPAYIKGRCIEYSYRGVENTFINKDVMASGALLEDQYYITEYGYLAQIGLFNEYQLEMAPDVARITDEFVSATPWDLPDGNWCVYNSTKTGGTRTEDGLAFIHIHPVHLKTSGWLQEGIVIYIPDLERSCKVLYLDSYGKNPVKESDSAVVSMLNTDTKVTTPLNTNVFITNMDGTNISQADMEKVTSSTLMYDSYEGQGCIIMDITHPTRYVTLGVLHHEGGAKVEIDLMPEYSDDYDRKLYAWGDWTCGKAPVSLKVITANKSFETPGNYAVVDNANFKISIDTSRASGYFIPYVIDFGQKKVGRLRIRHAGNGAEFTTPRGWCDSSTFACKGMIANNLDYIKNWSFGGHSLGATLGKRGSHWGEKRNHIADIKKLTPVDTTCIILQTPFVNEWLEQTPVETFKTNLTEIAHGLSQGNMIIATTLGTYKEEFLNENARPISYDDYGRATEEWCEIAGGLVTLVDCRKHLKRLVEDGVVVATDLFSDNGHPSPMANEIMYDMLKTIVDMKL